MIIIQIRSCVMNSQPQDKLLYLQNENNELRNDIQELKDIIKMNKTEIDILSAHLQSNPHHKKLIDVILGYRQREEAMQKHSVALKQELSQLVSDNLMLRQMNSELELEAKNYETLNQGIVESYNQKIKSLEEKLVFYEHHHKEYDKVSGFVLKNRDIVGPNELALELKQREGEWHDQIAIMKAEVEQAKKDSENLLVVNTVLRNKIISLQAKLAMPNKNLGEVLDKSLKRLMLYFIEVQKKIITGEEESDSDEENDLELIAPELSGLFPEKQLRIQKDYGVPHIDLLKIREQINHSTVKIKEALLARNHLSDKEKNERLEIELEYTRRELSRNIIDLRDERESRKKAETFIREIQTRNQMLVSSNQQLEAKVRKYWHKLQQEKTRAYGLKIDSGREQDYSNTNLEETLILNHPGNQRKQTIRQANRNGQSQIDYRIHLQILAKELEKNEKLNKLKDLKQRKPNVSQQESQPTFRIKRSTSNPFLYFNERREEIMNVREHQEGGKDERYRLEQTCFLPGDNMQFEEVLDDMDV